MATADNDRSAAQKYVATLREICDPAHPTQLVNLLSVEGAVLALCGDYVEGAKTAERAIVLARERAFPPSEQWALFMTRQRIEIADGDPLRAREALLREAPQMHDGMRRDMASVLADVALA